MFSKILYILLLVTLLHRKTNCPIAGGTNICESPVKKKTSLKTLCKTTHPIRVNHDRKNNSQHVLYVIIIVFQSVARRDGVYERSGFLFLYFTLMCDFWFECFSFVFTRNKTLKSRHSFPLFSSLTTMLKIVLPIIIVNNNNKLSDVPEIY